MKKRDFFLTLFLLLLAMAGICFLFSKTIWVNTKTLLLLALLIIYIPAFIFTAANSRGAKSKRARIFLYGGFILLILAAAVWHTFSADIGAGISRAQMEALRYYQQVIILLCSAVGGSSIFHGMRLFNEAINE
ncbi:MAG: hypothetical protein ABI443_05480 [Chthoniobacterales bacterium]